MNEMLATLTLAQSDAGATSVWALFRESFDFFSVVLVFGSLIAVMLIARVVMDCRGSMIAPKALTKRLLQNLATGNIPEIERALIDDDSIVGHAVQAAWRVRTRGHAAMRDAAEIAASNACARWTRPLDMLRIIGELGPLIGLAGTVWGMILAFVRLGQAGGSAGPTDLSLGISKALFHTLLGLVLAVPCLLVYGFYRSIVEKYCNEAMGDAGQLVDMIPTDDEN
ncbi:MAG: MotA/TolQ/ExbB proton channel family protein [Phycisphaerales bacterium]|nr:MotA/TolQ/ExbB proton channel family protein [Phycisphaerales bacterium]